MGLLDDLKNQAASRLEQQQSTRDEKNRNMRAVHVALREAQRYLIELSDSLNVLKPDVFRTFPIENNIQLDSLRQGDYAVRERRKAVDNQDYFEEVSLRFRNTGSRDLVFHKDTPSSIERTKEYLWGYNLRFECKEIKNERGLVERAVFKVASDIPAAASFTGNWDSGQTRLTLHNVEKLGPIEYLYTTDEIKHELLEELGKLLLGQPNNLRHLGRHQEMMMSSPRPRAAPKEVDYPASPVPESDPGAGLLDQLKSLIKR